MKFDLTLTTVLVFLVPGIVLLGGSPDGFLLSVDHWNIWKRPQNATDGVLLLSSVFLSGAFIDALRTITVQPLVAIVAKKLLKSPFPSDYFRSIDKDSIGVFQLVIERAYEYLRLNENLTLALAIVFCLRIFEKLCSVSGIAPLALALVWFAISVRSQRDLNQTLVGFVEAHPPQK